MLTFHCQINEIHNAARFPASHKEALHTLVSRPNPKETNKHTQRKEIIRFRMLATPHHFESTTFPLTSPLLVLLSILTLIAVLVMTVICYCMAPFCRDSFDSSSIISEFAAPATIAHLATLRDWCEEVILELQRRNRRQARRERAWVAEYVNERLREYEAGRSLNDVGYGTFGRSNVTRNVKGEVV